MRILFALYVESQVRHFTTVLRELAARGHEVTLLAVKWKRQTTVKLPQDLRDVPRLAIEPWPDLACGRWWPYVNAIRATRNCLPFHEPSLRASASRERIEGLADPFLLRLIGDGAALRFALAKRCFERLEDAVPPDPAVLECLRRKRPDLVLVSPLVSHVATTHTEFVKAARRLGIPVGFPVFSWDNLSTKGAVHDRPDRVYVWNAVQKEEAVRMHGLPCDSVSVHGAWRFDEYRELRPSIDRRALCERFGFAEERPIVLYLGSSPFIAPDEGRFVRKWLSAMRNADDERLRGANILIRSHPRNFEAWRGLKGMKAYPLVAMQPPESTSLFEQQVLFDLVHHSEIVVGVNTSAMLEAALLGRPVYSLKHRLLRRGQDDTQHFRYLTETGGGLIHLADSWKQHLAMMAAGLGAGRDEAAARSARFCRAFLDAPAGSSGASASLANAIEELGATRPAAHRPGLGARLLLGAVKLGIATGALPVAPRPEQVLMDPSAKPSPTDAAEPKAVAVEAREPVKRLA